MINVKKHSEKNKEDKLAIDIGNRILKARNGLGLSQELLHQSTKTKDLDGIGISRAVLSLYERGVNKPGSREITLLCDSLKISPNWLLLGSESAARNLQPSLIFLQGDDIHVSSRLAVGFLSLNKIEREALGSLILSMLTKQLGDSRLSSLMHVANSLADSLYANIISETKMESSNMSIESLIDYFVNQSTEAVYTTYGNFNPIIADEDIDNFNPENPPNARNLKL